MQAERAIELLNRQRSIAGALQQNVRHSPPFKKWKRDTEVILERIFPEGARAIEDFQSVRYSLSVASSSTPDSAWQEAYVDGLREADSVLSSIIDEIKEFDLADEQLAVAPDQLSLLERICLKFHLVARQLRARHASRPTLEIEDEYDVQDLLHAVLRLHFDDVRREEWTPSYAGRSARADFLLKDERIVVEVKKTRASLKDGDIGEQLLIDRERYSQHPDCDTLVCFVYDPEGRIGNPVGLERDLEQRDGPLRVRVIIAPKA